MVVTAAPDRRLDVRGGAVQVNLDDGSVTGPGGLLEPLSGSCPTLRSAWPAAPTGRPAGDHRGGAAGRRPLVRHDRAVLPHAAPGDPGTVVDLAAAVLHLACRPQRDDPALCAAAGGRRRVGPGGGRLAGRAGRR